MKPIEKKALRRQRRRKHVRKRVNGSPERPRLTVFRSHKYIYAQIIDDSQGHTLVASSSRETPVAGEAEGTSANRQAAAAVGRSLAERAIEAGIRKVVFDRNGYAYHGRVRDLAEAARQGGLEF
jgi:large subunit ribosomal protein L18